MPIYEYQCSACQARLEKLQKISDPPLLTCPECGADALVKLVSAAAFRLKGSGWYETDFKKDGKRNLAGDEKPGTDTSSAGESKSGGTDAAAGSSTAASKSAEGSSGSSSAKSSAKSSDTTSAKPAAAKPKPGSAA